MGNNINSVASMLDDLFERAKASDRKLACCKCIVDNRECIAAMDIANASHIITFFYDSLHDNHFIVNIAQSEDWEEADRKISGFLGCSDRSILTITSYASYWYSRLETNSDIVTDSIEQKRQFFICCYPETFDDHYDPSDEIGRYVLLITDFSDEFKQVHFYVHFEGTDEAFHLSEATNTPDLVWNMYCEFCDREEALQVKEREETNRFYPQTKYDVSDFRQIKSMFLKAVNRAFKSDIGIDSFRFRTDASSYAAEIIAVSSELSEVRVVIHNIDTNEYFSRTVPRRDYFEEIFVVDLFMALFPQEAKAIYNKKYFDPKFDKIQKEITVLLDKAVQEGTADYSFYGVNKEIPELGEKYEAEAKCEQNSNLVSLTVHIRSRKKPSFERTVEIGKPFEEMFSELYQFLYPDRIALLSEDIPE